MVEGRCSCIRQRRMDFLSAGFVTACGTREGPSSPGSYLPGGLALVFVIVRALVRCS